MTAADPPPARDYAAHIAALRQRLPAIADFAVVVEPPFVVLGNGGEQAVRDCAVHTVRWAVQRLRAAYFEQDPDRILDIWLFRDDASYRGYAKELFGDTPDTPFGYYSAAHGALVMNIATGTGTLVHEIVHPFMAANFPACPAWFNEGLASLYEQCGERDGAIVGFVNWRLAGLQQAITDRRMPRLSQLLATSSRAFYAEGSGLRYAVARYLLYWLQEQRTLPEFYRAFRVGAAADPTGIGCLQQALGIKDLDAWQPEFEAWVQQLQLPR